MRSLRVEGESGTVTVRKKVTYEALNQWNTQIHRIKLVKYFTKL